MITSLLSSNAGTTVPSRPRAVKASIHFLKPNERFEEEKPYAFRYGIETNDIPQTNMEMYEVPEIDIVDMRGREANFRLDTHGFEIMRLRSKLNRDDFFESEKLPTYFAELELLLARRLKARQAKVFRHGIRQRDTDFPTSTGKKYEYDQPTSVAHVDTTPEEMVNESHRQDEVAFDDHIEWINVWKPLRGPLNDWPLTLCDATTVEPEFDFEPADLLYPNLATENFQIYHSQKQRWYFLSDHRPDEVIVFRQASTAKNVPCGVPHCSFLNPNADKDEPPRESIEARLLLSF